LEARRRTLGTWSDNEERAQVDARLRSLRRVRTTGELTVVSRLEECASSMGLLSQDGMVVPPAALVAGPCRHATPHVVGPAQRLEELETRLRQGPWDYYNVDERRALQAELAAMKSEIP
jgi:hypothetical protein